MTLSLMVKPNNWKSMTMIRKPVNNPAPSVKNKTNGFFMWNYTLTYVGFTKIAIYDKRKNKKSLKKSAGQQV